MPPVFTLSSLTSSSLWPEQGKKNGQTQWFAQKDGNVLLTFEFVVSIGVAAIAYGIADGTMEHDVRTFD